MKVGYARVSTSAQVESLRAQSLELEAAGCERVFTDIASGARSDRPGLAAAVAGVIAHVPAGLGVLEAVFIALLGATVPEPRLLGALLAYRALYYIVPLAAAVPLYLRSEARATPAAGADRDAVRTDHRATA